MSIWFVVHFMVLTSAGLMFLTLRRRTFVDEKLDVPLFIAALLLVVLAILAGGLLVVLDSWQWLMTSVIPLALSVWVIARQISGLRSKTGRAAV